MTRECSLSCIVYGSSPVRNLYQLIPCSFPVLGESLSFFSLFFFKVFVHSIFVSQSRMFCVHVSLALLTLIMKYSSHLVFLLLCFGFFFPVPVRLNTKFVSLRSRMKDAHQSVCVCVCSFSFLCATVFLML